MLTPRASLCIKNTLSKSKELPWVKAIAPLPALTQYRLHQPADPDSRRQEQPERMDRRRVERQLADRAAQNGGAERRQGCEFDQGKDRDKTEPRAGDRGELD